ncbi:hypothetical protein [Martelella soudanensis]|uniref:hypothetical protein n=1 Tax=unclassified Martelella TaxID=2629616 RepID=UPI0015DD570F|nr:MULTISPECIES: hypothetical protein [unclassified Martelella]
MSIKNVFLLGAGASFGSGGCIPNAPPLGLGLFQLLEEKGEIAKSVDSDIAELFRENFEEGMTAFMERHPEKIDSFQREMALFFLQFQPKPDNVYHELIRRFYRNSIFSSTNYELIFELCANDIGLKIYYDSSRDDDGISLLKIHGSANFWPDLMGSQISGISISGSGTHIEAPVRPRNLEESIHLCEVEDSLSPAIAVYAPEKKSFICDEYVKDQYNKWVLSIQNAKRIFIIGVRVNLNDKHIWDKISNTKGKVYYFGMNSDKLDFFNWKRECGKVDAFFVESEFATSLKKISRFIRQ